jgi:hypothetical protein
LEFIKKLTFRYNPQSIEKQVRKWPVFFSVKDIHQDIVYRLNQIMGKQTQDWLNPFSIELPFEKEIIYEYGVDACRIATINSDKTNFLSLLESSYKWISKVHDSFYSQSKLSFNPIPWLSALTQMFDHITTRNSDRIALALVMKAFKLSPPNNAITEKEKMLIASCLFPFIPIYTASEIIKHSELPKIDNLLKDFNEYYCVKIALERGGWHWQVFSRNQFENDPVSELNKVKWINKAIKNKNVTMKKENGGILICFS